MARFYVTDDVYTSRAEATAKARRFLKSEENPGYALSEVEIEEVDGGFRWFIDPMDGAGEAVPSIPEPRDVVEPDLGVKVETDYPSYEAVRAEIEGGAVLTVVTDNPKPTEAEPVRSVVLAIEITSDLTEAVAKLLRGKIGGAVIRVCDADDPSVVLEEIPTAKPGKLGRGDRDWTVKPVIASAANKSAQSRLDKIEAAEGNVAKLRELLAGIDPASNQTYTVMARRYCEALLAKARAEQAEQYAMLRAAGFDVGEAAD